MNNAPLTKSKKKWVKNRNVTLRGLRLNYNASIQYKYIKSLMRLFIEMSKEVKDKLYSLFKEEIAEEFFIGMDSDISSMAKLVLNKLNSKFDKLFNFYSRKLSKKMIDSMGKISKSNLHTSLKQLSGGLSLNTGLVPDDLKTVAKALIEENVSLIKSIPSEYFTQITGSVMRSITTGNGLPNLLKDLNKYSNQNKRRIKNLALDQTRKAYNTINRQKMEALGIKQFEWVHSGGGQFPRKSHIAMNGNIYNFDDLPIINKEQVNRGYESPIRGIPGQAINCGCTMVPVINFDEM